MKTLAIIALFLLPAVLGCQLPEGDDQAAALTAPSLFTGVWTTPVADPPMRATVATLGATVTVNVTLASDPTSRVLLLVGTVDPDGRHLLEPCTVDGVARRTYTFVSADGARMFVGVRDDGNGYAWSAVFLRSSP